MYLDSSNKVIKHYSPSCFKLPFTQSLSQKLRPQSHDRAHPFGKAVIVDYLSSCVLWSERVIAQIPSWSEIFTCMHTFWVESSLLGNAYFTKYLNDHPFLFKKGFDKS